MLSGFIRGITTIQSMVIVVLVIPLNFCDCKQIFSVVVWFIIVSL